MSFYSAFPLRVVQMKQNRKILTLQLERRAMVIIHIYAEVIASLTLMFFMDNYYSLRMVVIIESTTPQAPLGHFPVELLAQTPFQWQRSTG